MAGLLEKTMLVGLGVFTMTRDKIKEAVDELVEEEEVEQEEARKLIDALVSKGEKERDELRKMIRQEVDRVKPVTRKEFDELHQKVDALSVRIEQLAEEEAPEEETD